MPCASPRRRKPAQICRDPPSGLPADRAVERGIREGGIQQRSGNCSSQRWEVQKRKTGGGRDLDQLNRRPAQRNPGIFFLNSADSLKLGVSDAFVIDEAQLESKMRTQSRLQKISTAISLFSMAMSFSVLGLMIVVNQHDGGASIPGGIFGILLGATFLIAACLHLKRFQGGFQLEEVPADEIVSEMQQAAEAMCSF